MLIQRTRLTDSRGYFERVFCSNELAEAGWKNPVAQINHTQTVHRGTVRGLHFQHPPHAEMKLVMCTKGEVLDVAVDLRADSPTFLRFHCELLSEREANALLIPEGYAHGFQTLTDDVEMLYLHSAPYAPEAEGGIHPLDSRVAISWPLAVSELSARDSNHPKLDEEFRGIRL
jgi:dTDP-4-dehydrorhamnose 3,5-epimerase